MDTMDFYKLLNPEVAATTLGLMPIASKNVTKQVPPPAPSAPDRNPDINPTKLSFLKVLKLIFISYLSYS